MADQPGSKVALAGAPGEGTPMFFIYQHGYTGVARVRRMENRLLSDVAAGMGMRDIREEND